ncbi:unnamed protein product [Ranitomeya imitator]|uniref:Uncharacterized protein n=1 Tax=Ranitomeya imitator TaxID=111125 RepID=A0ABN9M4E0_9NEOB|nr:unnamed protein product [Ranitomeya imitator]
MKQNNAWKELVELAELVELVVSVALVLDSYQVVSNQVLVQGSLACTLEEWYKVAQGEYLVHTQVVSSQYLKQESNPELEQNQENFQVLAFLGHSQAEYCPDQVYDTQELVFSLEWPLGVESNRNLKVDTGFLTRQAYLEVSVALLVLELVARLDTLLELGLGLKRQLLKPQLKQQNMEQLQLEVYQEEYPELFLVLYLVFILELLVHCQVVEYCQEQEYLN